MKKMNAFNVALKAALLFGLCLAAVLSDLFRASKAEASYIIEKKCLQSQSKKKSLSRRKKICFCVVSNLQSRLDAEQTQKLEKIYKDRHSRIAASKDDLLKPLIEIDYEVNKNCSLNTQWKWPTEDLGSPDPL